MDYSIEDYEFCINEAERRFDNVGIEMATNYSARLENMYYLEGQVYFVAGRELKHAQKKQAQSAEALKPAEEQDVRNIIKCFNAKSFKSFTDYLVEEKIYVQESELRKRTLNYSCFDCYDELRIKACEELLESAAQICYDKLSTGEFSRVNYYSFNNEFRDMIDNLSSEQSYSAE